MKYLKKNLLILVWLYLLFKAVQLLLRPVVAKMSITFKTFNKPQWTMLDKSLLEGENKLERAPLETLTNIESEKTSQKHINAL